MNENRAADAVLKFEKRGASSLSRSQSYELISERMNRTFLIDVAFPAAPVPVGEVLPVVYVLDGNGMFALVAQTARLMQSGAEPLPPMLIVGVGYKYSGGEGSRWEHFGFRHRDFSPTSDPRVLELLLSAPPPYEFPQNFRLGGAAQFLDFMNDELKPFVSSQYAVDQRDQTLLGFSLGGLFVLNTLFTSPTSFGRYIAGSPGLSWDDGVAFKREAALAKIADDVTARLFLSVGSLEEDESDDVASRRVSNVAAMASVLRAREYASLQLTHYVFPEERHFSVIPATVSRGLRAVFL